MAEEEEHKVFREAEGVAREGVAVDAERLPRVIAEEVQRADQEHDAA